MDGVSQGLGTSFNLNTSTMTVAAHTVSATATDVSPMVRNDPTHLLDETRTWNVTVTNPATRRGQLTGD